MSIESNTRLVILDNFDDVDQFDDDIKAYLSESLDGISISNLIVKSKKILIKEYLDMTYSLGFNEDEGANIHRKLLIRPNFSFWWMTLLAEKSPIRSKSIYKILQFRTIEKLFYEKKCTHIVLCSNDKKLHKLLLNWSKKSGFNYERKLTKSNSSINMYDIYQHMPNFVKAFIMLARYIFSKRYFVGNLKKTQFDDFDDPKLAKRFIICPFPSFDQKKASNGIFQSNYWGEIQPLLDSDVNVNFLFMFTPGVDCKNVQEAIKKRDILNNKSNGSHHYYFIEEWLSFSIFLKIITDYFFLYRKSFNQNSIKKKSFLAESKNSYWELFKPEWLSSTRGVVAMDGCIRLRLFEECLRSFKNPVDGFYLLENQPWERALNYSWSNYFNTPLFGVQNNPFRPFDLRFYEDERIYKHQLLSALPIPSLMLTNGKYSESNILEFGYPKKMITHVEAYKYSYLTKDQKYSDNSNLTNKKNTLLVITDGLPIFAKKQLKMLGEALHLTESNKFNNIIIKPHPFFDVTALLKKYLYNIKYEVTNEPLESLWNKANTVYVSNMTSAAIESLIIGLPTIIYLDNKTINLSPALDFEGAMFATSKEIFNYYLNYPVIPNNNNNYLLIDKDLKRWKDFLDSNGS